MIREDLYPIAQKVIQYLVIDGRAMAYDNAPHQRIASLLDDVEHLIDMLHNPRECTEDFAAYLEGTTKRFEGIARHYYDQFADQLGEPVASEPVSDSLD